MTYVRRLDEEDTGLPFLGPYAIRARPHRYVVDRE
jgi:hypothetical protein